jgi:hypothetical protein
MKFFLDLGLKVIEVVVVTVVTVIVTEKVQRKMAENG